MAVSEQDRHDLHVKLVTVLGRKEAAAMMGLVPPVGWADVATKRDLDHLAERMDARFAATHSDMNARFAATHSDIAALAERMDARFDAFGERMDARFDAFGEMLAAAEERTSARIANAQTKLMTVMVGSMLAAIIAVLGLAFGAAGLA